MWHHMNVFLKFFTSMLIAILTALYHLLVSYMIVLQCPFSHTNMVDNVKRMTSNMLCDM